MAVKRITCTDLKEENSKPNEELEGLRDEFKKLKMATENWQPSSWNVQF